MGKIFIDEPGVISLETVDCEEDLRPIPRKLNINPPPGSGRCDCCGRPVSELKPFGGPGDPLIGDFTGAYLIKKFRREEPLDTDAYRAVQAAMEGEENQDSNHVREVLIKKYGKKRGRRYYKEVMCYSVGSSWECRDCAPLDMLEHYERCMEVANSSNLDDF